MEKAGNWADAVSGAGAGAVAKTVTAPLERVKLVLQNQELAAARGRQAPLSGLVDALRRLPHEEGGIASLWRGNGTNVLRVLPTYASRFWLYGQCERALPQSLQQPDVRRLCAGALAGAGALLVTHPLDTVRTRLAAARLGLGGGQAYAGPADCLRETWRREGVRGLYAGCAMSLVEIAPYTAVAFAGYEGVKQRLCRKEGGHASMPARLVAGLVSGITATTLCYPLDTMRRQLMLEGSRGFEARYCRSAAHCLVQLWREGGVPRFYRGWTATVLKSAPSVAITFTVRDWLLEGINLASFIQAKHRWTGSTSAVTSPCR